MAKTKKSTRIKRVKKPINVRHIDHPVELLRFRTEGEFNEYMKLVYNLSIHIQITLELMDSVIGNKTLYKHVFKKRANDFIAELVNFQDKVIMPNYSEMQEVFNVHHQLVNSLIEEFITKPTLVDKVRLKGFIHAGRLEPLLVDEFINEIANKHPNKAIF